MLRESNINLRQLTSNQYPGRAIIIGCTPDMRYMVQVYFIMGRSESSRNRTFEYKDDILRTMPREGDSNDPLRIYNAAMIAGDAHIITNGKQTDTIHDYITNGKTFEAALDEWSFEPDPPIYTPRISGVNYMDSGKYTLSILKSGDGKGEHLTRQFFHYAPIRGYGHLIHVYKSDGNPPPAFAGEPMIVPIFDEPDKTLAVYWDAIDSNNKIAMFVKYISIAGGKVTHRIVTTNS